MKHIRVILPLILCTPLIVTAAQRIDTKPIPATMMAGRIKPAPLSRESAKVVLGAEKAEDARLEATPKLRALNARRGTIELRTQNIRAMKKKKATIDITND